MYEKSAHWDLFSTRVLRESSRKLQRKAGDFLPKVHLTGRKRTVHRNNPEGTMTTSIRKVTKVLLTVSAILVLVTMLLSSPPHISRRLPGAEILNRYQGVGAATKENDLLAPDFTTSTTCTPRTSILFLKTHKCASSTVQNILMRYGERRGLNFVLGGRGNYMGSPAPFRRRYIGDDLWPRSGRFDIFTHHTRLNIEETRQILQPGAAFVTILRDPVDQFESMYDYFDFEGPLAWNMTLKDFIKLPIEKKQALKRIGHGKFGGNQMAFDLGYDPAIAKVPRLVDLMLQELDEAFDLVLISEMMDESLILLRQMMCWSTDDVVYLTKNARFTGHRAQLSLEERSSLEEFLALDMILYRHFGEKLAQQIATVPLGKFLSWAELLVARRLFFKQRCVSAEVNGGELIGQQHEINGNIKGYQLSDPTDWMCSRLTMAELGYTNLIRDQQRERQVVWRRLFTVLGLNRTEEERPPEAR